MSKKQPSTGGTGSSRGKIPASLLNYNSKRGDSSEPKESTSKLSSSAVGVPKTKKEHSPSPFGQELSVKSDPDQVTGLTKVQRREQQPLRDDSRDGTVQAEAENSDFLLPGPSGNINRSESLNDLSRVVVDRFRNLGLGRTNLLEEAQSSNLTIKSPYENRGLTGLRNIGNTCFMNSILQCLSNTMPLLKYILIKQTYAEELNTTNSTMKGTLMKAFAKLIQDMWSESMPDEVDTYSLKSQIQRFNTTFRGARQHDSQELLRFLLEGLHSDVNRVTQKPKVGRVLEINSSLPEDEQSRIAWNHYRQFDNSKVADIFVGQLKSALTCLTCGYRSVTFDPFWDLSLSIPSVGGRGFSSSNAVKLEQCLQLFTQEEILEGDEKPNCERCKARRSCSKKFTIQKFPEVLVIHLKRFTSDDRGKLRTSVKFPIAGLNMSPYGEAANVSYNLYGISNHFGTAFSGHYIAYCMHPYNGGWSCYDDARVSPISEETLNTVEGYVLFYQMSLASKSLLGLL